MILAKPLRVTTFRRNGLEYFALIDSARLDLPELKPGSVWLVGAGPGDPGLLSVLALHALGQADAIVCDALVDRRVLGLARDGALIEDAGKRGGRPSPRQPDISARLIALARDGKRVLRLKGGDPCVFGRGGEEALALAEAGVPFRIVPGITAAIGGLAYAGIPLTHRGINSAVTLITGHNSDGTVPGEEDSAPDWAAIARGSPVIVLYMALRHLDDIAARLIAAGRAADEPVAIVSKATTAAQLVVISSLADAAAAAKNIDGPAIIAIGEIVRLHQALDWYGR
jgi:uroporphyrin-III C-methyltransferase